MRWSSAAGCCSATSRPQPRRRLQTATLQGKLSWCPLRSTYATELFGRHGLRRASRRHVALVQLFLQPERVMFLGQIDIDLTGPHRLECTLHADGADVDMSQHGGDEEHGDHGV